MSKTTSISAFYFDHPIANFILLSMTILLEITKETIIIFRC